MLCKVDGCGRSARYKAARLCQKHYFRQYRYGTTETTRVGKGRDRYVTPSGYVYIRRPNHPLALTSGLVSEHRALVFDDLGPGPMRCALCGIEVTWETVHIDHIDETTDNNVRSNLRPTCSVCNTRRGRRPEYTYKGRLAISFDGVTQTANEWADDPRVCVSNSTISRRLKDGKTIEDALFGPKVTHNGNVRVKPPRKPASTRKNAVNACIDGVTATSAEWSRDPRCSVTNGVVRKRIRDGWPHADAVFLPPRAKRPTTPPANSTSRSCGASATYTGPRSRN